MSWVIDAEDSVFICFSLYLLGVILVPTFAVYECYTINLLLCNSRSFCMKSLYSRNQREVMSYNV